MKKTISHSEKRQALILSLISERGAVSISQILELAQKELNKISRITISRDLEKMMNLGMLQRKGAGRSVLYELSVQYASVKKIDVEKYFSVEMDQRKIREKFNFSVYGQLENIFTANEKQKLLELNEVYQKKIKLIPAEILKKEIERLNIDFSWKSSKIEGNTYSLLETEQLLKNKEEAKGHSKDEAVMILNHKKTLEYIQASGKDFQEISVRKIENIHSLLVDDLETMKGLRKTLVRITGTNYFPLDNEFQIREALEKTCALVNEKKDVFEKAVVLMLLIAYIQPFIDGNKRTSRLYGNSLVQCKKALN